MALSSYTLDYFDLAREKLHITRGLQSIGETRFGTIYWSLDSVLGGTKAFIDVVQDTSLGIDSKVCDSQKWTTFTVAKIQLYIRFSMAYLMMTTLCLNFNETSSALELFSCLSLGPSNASRRKIQIQAMSTPTG